MGCDIHAFVDYNEKGDDFVMCLGEFDLGRNYNLFGILAGVRSFGIPCVVEPKGLPDKISWNVDYKYYLRVNENATCLCCDGTDGVVSKQTADRYIQQHGSKLISDNKITHPDWHTTSWLNVEEVDSAIRLYKKTFHKTAPVVLRCILAAMKKLSRKNNVRLVFWFDS